MGSLYFTRPTLVTYTAKREDLLASAAAVFDMVKKGAIKILIGQRYRLADVAWAHADLEGGRTKGSSILVP
jgi:NADPH2:quinone reductase